MLWPHKGGAAAELGRVDLDIRPRGEVVLEVTLSRAGLAYVRAQHRVRTDLVAFYQEQIGQAQFAPITILSSPATPKR